MTNISVGQLAAAEPATAGFLTNASAAVAPQSFMDELSQTFAETQLKLSIDPNNLPPSAGNPSSQADVVRRDSVAAGRNLVAANFNPVAANRSPVAAGSTPKVQPIGFNALIPMTATTAPPATAAAPAPAPDSTDAILAGDDAYWAKQPAAVQQLRYLNDPQKGDLATQLMTEGYSIDVPIMLWGWDPTKTTELRQQYGYTWVPAAMQSPVTAAPGLSGLGITPYDPAHPPAGSISV